MNSSEEQQQARFEQQLTEALAHVDPPPEFADRVVALAARGEARPVRLILQPQFRRWYALAALLLVALLSLLAGRLHREQQRRVKAEREFDQAIVITGHALDHTRAQLLRAGIHLHP